MLDPNLAAAEQGTPMQLMSAAGADDPATFTPSELSATEQALIDVLNTHANTIDTDTSNGITWSEFKAWATESLDSLREATAKPLPDTATWDAGDKRFGWGDIGQSTGDTGVRKAAVFQLPGTAPATSPDSTALVSPAEQASGVYSRTLYDILTEIAGPDSVIDANDIALADSRTDDPALQSVARIMADTSYTAVGATAQSPEALIARITDAVNRLDAASGTADGSLTRADAQSWDTPVTGLTDGMDQATAKILLASGLLPADPAAPASTSTVLAFIGGPQPAAV